MQPNGSKSVSFHQQFVELLLRFVGIIQQYRRVANQLLHILHADVHRTPRQVVAISHPTYLLIQLRRAIAAVDSYRLLRDLSTRFAWSR